ncbi:unnamed protein product [Dovyalis caffra]|uniref:Expansin-like EG45 domain-containing protein n=1 Tax=Dovyalis caffra TaxID=77055 RepID=A0AAV1S548_9ROSI|nr:unnamed protein product [Dovyalis caffra]
MAIAIRALFLAGLLISLVSVASAIAGTATYYNVYVPSACYGFQDQGVMIAAASDALYDNGAACGRMYRVTCTGATNQGVPQPCKGGSVTVKIVDRCPSPACRATIDLSQEAFSQIADINAGKINIDYTPRKYSATHQVLNPNIRKNDPNIPLLCFHISSFTSFLSSVRPRPHIGGQMDVSSNNSMGGIHLNKTRIQKCTSLPPYVNSNGFLQDEDSLKASLPILELHMFAIFLISHGFHFILKRWGIHILVSQILAGVIIGTTVLGRDADYARVFFTIDSKQILGTLAGIGFQLLGFLNGIKMDLSLVRKTGKMAIYSGILSMVMPVLIGGVTAKIASKYWSLKKIDKLSLYLVMLVQSMTPFPVVCNFIGDLKLTHSELGRMGLSSALTSEMLSQCVALSAFFLGIAYKQRAPEAVKAIAICIAFLILVLYVVRPAMFWVIKQTPKGRPVKGVYTDIIILGAFVSGALFDYFGLNVFLGSLVFGLAVPAGPPLASAVVEKLECIVTGVLVPLFMAMCTMGADFLKIDFGDYLLKSTAIVVFVVILTKFVSYLVPLLYFKLPKQDALSLAFLISTKGIVELGSFTYMKELGVC